MSLLESYQIWASLGDPSHREVNMDEQIYKWIRWIHECVAERLAMQEWMHELVNG